MLSLVAALALGSFQEPAFPKNPLKVIGLIDVAGKARAVPAAGAKATVVVFVMTDCPIANRMAPEISRIAKAYSARKVAFLMAYVDPEKTDKQVAAHLKSYGYVCPGVLDKKHVLVDAIGASVTPQAGVVDARGRLVYRGRINDLFEEHGKPRTKARKHDLRRALDEVLAGKAVTNPLVSPIGCFIPK